MRQAKQRISLRIDSELLERITQYQSERNLVIPFPLTLTDTIVDLIKKGFEILANIDDYNHKIETAFFAKLKKQYPDIQFPSNDIQSLDTVRQLSDTDIHLFSSDIQLLDTDIQSVNDVRQLSDTDIQSIKSELIAYFEERLISELAPVKDRINKLESSLDRPVDNLSINTGEFEEKNIVSEDQEVIGGGDTLPLVAVAISEVVTEVVNSDVTDTNTTEDNSVISDGGDRPQEVNQDRLSQGTMTQDTTILSESLGINEHKTLTIYDTFDKIKALNKEGKCPAHIWKYLKENNYPNLLKKAKKREQRVWCLDSYNSFLTEFCDVVSNVIEKLE